MISISAINGSQNNLLSVSEFNFDCKSLVVGYDFETFIFPFLVGNYAFFHQMLLIFCFSLLEMDLPP